MKLIQSSLFAYSILASTNFSFASTSSRANAPTSKYIDIQVIPVGPIPLARFRISSGDNSGVSVITLPEDERAPQQLYIKRKGSYYSLSCNQNSIGTPYRIPYQKPEISFYYSKTSDDGSLTFREAFSYKVKPSQKNVLITLSKPLSQKLWTDPEVNTYNLSKIDRSKPITIIINASSSQYLGLKMNNSSSVLAPQGIFAAPVTTDKVKTLKFSASQDQQQWSKLQQITLPNKPAETNIIISFEVSKNDSSRGFELIRGKLKRKKVRKLVKRNS